MVIRGLVKSGTPSGVIANTAGGEDEVYRAAGLTDRRRIEIASGPVERSIDEVVASIFSLSSSTPYLFGDQGPEFERGLRGLLDAASPAGVFSEQMGEIVLDLWTR